MTSERIQRRIDALLERPPRPTGGRERSARTAGPHGRHADGGRSQGGFETRPYPVIPLVDSLGHWPATPTPAGSSILNLG